MGEQITLEEYKAATSLDPQASYASIIRCATSTDQRADNMRYALSLPGLARLRDVPEPQTEPVAVVGLGPSLHDTWEKIRDFRYVLSMSGSHRFLIDRAIVPTWHLDIDPRFYKYRLIGQPHSDVRYLISSHCHPQMFKHLEGFNVTLIHPQTSRYETIRLVPRGEWAFQAGPSVGHKALVLARYLGFSDIHVFGMDGCLREIGGTIQSHAVSHPNKVNRPLPTEYDGAVYQTTPVLIAYSQSILKILNRLSDSKIVFYGNGLLQHMTRNHTAVPEEHGLLCVRKEELVTPGYRAQLAELHGRRVRLWEEGAEARSGRARKRELVTELVKVVEARSVLDYGCGTGQLAAALDFPIWEFDPAVTGKDTDPRPADLVVCFDVLEHVEPEKLRIVLQHMDLCTKTMLYAEISLRPARKELADGRNAHLIVETADWWREQLERYFVITKEHHSVDYYCVFLTRKYPFPEDPA